MQRFHRMKTLQQYMKSTIGGIVGSVFLDWHLFHRSTTLSYGSLDAKLWFWREMTDETTRCSSFWGKIEWICGLEMGVFQGVWNRCLGPGRWILPGFLACKEIRSLLKRVKDIEVQYGYESEWKWESACACNILLNWCKIKVLSMEVYLSLKELYGSFIGILWLFLMGSNKGRRDISMMT